MTTVTVLRPFSTGGEDYDVGDTLDLDLATNEGRLMVRRGFVDPGGTSGPSLPTVPEAFWVWSQPGIPVNNPGGAMDTLELGPLLDYVVDDPVNDWGFDEGTVNLSPDWADWDGTYLTLSESGVYLVFVRAAGDGEGVATPQAGVLGTSLSAEIRPMNGAMDLRGVSRYQAGTVITPYVQLEAGATATNASFMVERLI